MAQRGNGLEGRREWFTRVKALPERACRKTEKAVFALANEKATVSLLEQVIP